MGGRALTLSAFRTKKDTYTNSVDPDETAHLSRLIRIYNVCRSFYFYLGSLFATVDSKMEDPTSETSETQG